MKPADGADGSPGPDRNITREEKLMMLRAVVHADADADYYALTARAAKQAGLARADWLEALTSAVEVFEADDAEAMWSGASGEPDDSGLWYMWYLQRQKELGTKLLPVTQARYFVEHEPPVRRWLLDELLPAGEVSMLVGAGGTGKSWLALQVAFSVATGFPLFGRVNTANRGRVLLLTAEDRFEEMHRRCHRVWRHLCAYANRAPDPDRLAYLDVACLSGANTHLVAAGRNGAARTAMCDTVVETVFAEGGCTLVILDPVSRFYGADENDNAHCTEFVAAVEDMSLRTRAAFLLVHHAGKSVAAGAVTQERARGGSALTAAVRQVTNLTTMREEEALQHSIPENQRTWYARMDVTKANYAAPSGTTWLSASSTSPGRVHENGQDHRRRQGARNRLESWAEQ